MVQMPEPIAAAAVNSQLRREAPVADSARRVQRSPSAAPTHAITYDSVGVSQPKLKWFMVPMGPPVDRSGPGVITPLPGFSRTVRSPADRQMA